MPEYVALKHKDSSVPHYAAVVPDGVTEDEVLEAWKPLGWSRAAKAEIDDLLDKQATTPAVADQPVTTTKEK